MRDAPNVMVLLMLLLPLKQCIQLNQASAKLSSVPGMSQRVVYVD